MRKDKTVVTVTLTLETQQPLPTQQDFDNFRMGLIDYWRDAEPYGLGARIVEIGEVTRGE